MNDFPKELVEITEFLATQTEITIKGSGQDRRRDSAEIELKIINLLENQNRWIIENPDSQKDHNRSWYDFSVLDKYNKKKFINIKVSICNTLDNTNCMGGIYYVLTGEIPPLSSVNILPKIKSNLKENSNDYYFLVVKKPTRTNNDIPNAFLCSLKTLKTIKSSGDNLPFQCKWVQNIKPQIRSYHEAYHFILKSYGKSLRKRAKRYESFKKCFPDINLEDGGDTSRDA